MNRETSRRAHAWQIAGVAAAVLVLQGCGGGGGDSSSPPPAQPADQSLSGIVIDGPIQGATVCLDLNGNGACDSGEPASAATDAQGAYTISGLTAAQVNAGAALIAVIPATATDSGVAVGTAYQLAAPAGKGAVISPITHLVQTGVSQGMTREEAEAAVATQLQVSAASLYNDYTASTSGDNAALATIVPTVVASLQAGETPVVSTPSSAAAGYWVRSLEYTDANNYSLRYFYSSNVPDAGGLYTYYDERTRVSGGTPVAAASLYDSALIATPQGWKAFNGSTPNTSTGGSPSVSTYSYGYIYVGTRVDIDVGGQSLASVVSQAQDLTVNTVSTLVGVDASHLSGTMPSGAKIRRYTTSNTAAPVGYRTSDGTVGSLATLASLIANFPVPATPAASNTASMYSLHGESVCSSALCPQEWLRVAFGASGAASYYLCDLASNGAQSNCTSAGTGTYTLETAVDGVTPILKFHGLPAAASSQTSTRVFVERSGHVYYGWQANPSSYVQTRLNKVAFEALAAALGIAAPTIGDAASAYAGTWSASYLGADTGSCSSILVDAAGALSGSCVSTTVGGTFIVSGHVTSTGAATFTAGGATSSGASFTGSFSSTSGSGSWDWPSHGSGTWTATKQ